jgi:hypothetical protein
MRWHANAYAKTALDRSTPATQDNLLGEKGMVFSVLTFALALEAAPHTVLHLQIAACHARAQPGAGQLFARCPLGQWLGALRTGYCLMSCQQTA